MTHPFDPAEALRRARLDAHETQLSLAMKIREKFPEHDRPLPCRETVSRIEKRRERPQGITWSYFRAVLPELQAMA